MIAVDFARELVEYTERKGVERYENDRGMAEGFESKDAAESRLLNVRGVIGEVAAKIIQGLDPFTIETTFAGPVPDVGGCEVRCRARATDALYLKGTEPPDRLVMLFTAEDYESRNAVYFRRWGICGRYLAPQYESNPKWQRRHRRRIWWVEQAELEPAETFPALRADWKECEGLRFVNTNGLPYSHADFLYWRELGDKHEARRRGCTVAELLTPAEIRRRKGEGPFFD